MASKRAVSASLSVFLALSGYCSSALSEDAISVCVDKAYWYPFTFVQINKAEGLYVDMLNEAGKISGDRFRIRPMDWTACLEQARKGEVQMVLRASYVEARAKFLSYPADADSASVSAFRLTQAEYVVVNRKDNPYEFEGNILDLPKPVMVPQGYSVGVDLKAGGLNDVDSASKGDLATLLRLVTQDDGSVVTLRNMAELLAEHPSFKDKLKIQTVPFVSKSYFAAFSSSSNFPLERQQAIWEAIAQVRENKVLMGKLLSQYKGDDL
jgi:hypothetical protein